MEEEASSDTQAFGSGRLSDLCEKRQQQLSDPSLQRGRRGSAALHGKGGALSQPVGDTSLPSLFEMYGRPIQSEQAVESGVAMIWIQTRQSLESLVGGASKAEKCGTGRVQVSEARALPRPIHPRDVSAIAAPHTDLRRLVVADDNDRRRKRGRQVRRAGVCPMMVDPGGISKAPPVVFGQRISRDVAPASSRTAEQQIERLVGKARGIDAGSANSSHALLFADAEDSLAVAERHAGIPVHAADANC